jgi:hypothetical protein
MRQERLARGLLVACATAMIVAFLGGCVYGAFLGTPEGVSFRLTADALSFMLFVGGVTAVCAAPIAGIASFALGLPLFGFCVSRNYASPLVYVGGGVLISLVVAGLLALGHHLAGFLGPGPNIRLGISAALAAGPFSALAFWFVVRPLPSAG